MHRALAAVLVLVLVPPPEVRAADDVEQALARVKKLGGGATRDEKRPGQPVVKVSFAFQKAVKDDDLKELAPLTEVTELNLESTSVTPAGMKHLAPLKNLTALNLNATKLSDSGLKDLAALPKLTNLSIYSCSHTEESLKELAQVKTLTALVASSALFDLNDGVLKEWTALKNLRSLKLHGPQITDEGLKSVAAFTELTELLIWFPGKTTPDGWKPLGRLAKLKSLSLAGGNVPKPEGGNITDAVLSHFAPLADMEKLDLVETGVTDAGLATVGKFTKLTFLRVESSAAVTDAGVKHLTGLKDLTALNLTGASVTDGSVKALAALKKLTKLEVGRTLVTKEGAKELRDALPGCEVTWYPRR